MKSVVVLGMFDGVHIGHARLLSEAEKISRRGFLPIVYTFSNHPADMFSDMPQKRILTNDERDAKIGRLFFGAEVVSEPFSEELSKMTPTEFTSMLSRRFNAGHVVVGFNYTFGRNRSGNAEALKVIGSKYGFETQIVPPVLYDGEVVSSTRIRTCIENGGMVNANEMLNEAFSVTACVVENKHIGRRIGFPTANIVDMGAKPVPKFGVYATYLHHNGIRYSAVTNVGNNPTFGENGLSVETHVFDYDEELYGKMITVEFVDYIREQKTFASVDELVEQIGRDKLVAKNVLIRAQRNNSTHGR